MQCRHALCLQLLCQLAQPFALIPSLTFRFAQQHSSAPELRHAHLPDTAALLCCSVLTAFCPPTSAIRGAEHELCVSTALERIQV